MQSPSKIPPTLPKREYQVPKLSTHGTIAKLTQDPHKPKTHGRWAVSDISIS